MAKGLIKGLLIVIAIAYFTGINPQQLLGLLGAVEQMAPPPSAQQAPAGPPPADDPQAQFVHGANTFLAASDEGKAKDLLEGALKGYDLHYQLWETARNAMQG